VSRVWKKPVTVPQGVNVTLNGQHIAAKGPAGEGEFTVHPLVEVSFAEGEVSVRPREESARARALAGTSRVLANNLINGVKTPFSRKLDIVGVGYRAQVQGKTLNLSLGFSHPVEFPIPEGITIECPTQTEILVKGVDKQSVGQVAANIRAWRPPEPYKGKGVKYSDEVIQRKEAKKS
jgi:large subunit ribosomal protein L6